MENYVENVNLPPFIKILNDHKEIEKKLFNFELKLISYYPHYEDFSELIQGIIRFHRTLKINKSLKNKREMLNLEKGVDESNNKDEFDKENEIKNNGINRNGIKDSRINNEETIITEPQKENVNDKDYNSEEIKELKENTIKNEKSNDIENKATNIGENKIDLIEKISYKKKILIISEPGHNIEYFLSAMSKSYNIPILTLNESRISTFNNIIFKIYGENKKQTSLYNKTNEENTNTTNNREDYINTIEKQENRLTDKNGKIELNNEKESIEKDKSDDVNREQNLLDNNKGDSKETEQINKNERLDLSKNEELNSKTEILFQIEKTKKDIDNKKDQIIIRWNFPSEYIFWLDLDKLFIDTEFSIVNQENVYKNGNNQMNQNNEFYIHLKPIARKSQWIINLIQELSKNTGLITCIATLSQNIIIRPNFLNFWDIVQYYSRPNLESRIQYLQGIFPPKEGFKLDYNTISLQLEGWTYQEINQLAQTIFSNNIILNNSNKINELFGENKDEEELLKMIVKNIDTSSFLKFIEKQKYPHFYIQKIYSHLSNLREIRSPIPGATFENNFSTNLQGISGSLNTNNSQDISVKTKTNRRIKNILEEQFYQDAAFDNYDNIIIVLDKLAKNLPLDEKDRSILGDYPFVLKTTPQVAMRKLRAAKLYIERLTSKNKKKD